MALDAAERAQHPSGRGGCLSSLLQLQCGVPRVAVRNCPRRSALPFLYQLLYPFAAWPQKKIERTRSRETRILFLAGYPQGVVQVRRILVGRHIMSTSDQCQGQRGVFLPAEAWKRPCR